MKNCAVFLQGIVPLIGISIFSSPARADTEEPLRSYFDCKEVSSGRFRPFYMQAINGGTEYKDYSKIPKGLLGQNPMSSMEECRRAIDHANAEFGVICSRTGLDGWKPTLYTGTLPGRADFGYLGGSSIMDFASCLKGTQHSSGEGVCFWGGSSWYVAPIDRAGIRSGPYRTVDECVQETGQS